jgi:hypothetical protein
MQNNFGAGGAKPHDRRPDANALAEAERRFKQLTGAGFTAASRRGKTVVLKSFDPGAEETLFIPRLQGG